MDDALRSRLYLRALLPLLPAVADTRVDFCVPGDRVRIGGDGAPHLSFAFSSHGACQRFFTGKPAVPHGALKHPLRLARFVGALSGLRLLDPRAVPRPSERTRRIDLLLRLIARGLTELARGGDPAMKTLVDKSPERVYQWSVKGTDLGSFIRMRRGEVHCGAGLYAKRAAFVHYRFASIDDALVVLAAKESQIDNVYNRRLETLGCPEYTRKIALMMQRLDELLG